MITVSELEAIIAQTPPGEHVQYEAKLIGSVDYVTRKLTELKLSRSSDPDYLGWIASPICQGLIYDRHRERGRAYR